MAKWTARKEIDVTCEGSLGDVRNGEKVARLRIKMDPPAGWQPFKARDFLPPADTLISNVCGESDGCSVDRLADMSNADIVARSQTFAAAAQKAAESRKPQKHTRVGGGALIAEVAAIRELRVSSLGNDQVLYVYADPRPDNAEHAIIRMNELVLEEEFPTLLHRVKKAFNRDLTE